jgi:hypothetical protein
MAIVGLALIGASLWFNIWSRSQQAIDDLAEEMSWAIVALLNRAPRPAIDEGVSGWEIDFRNWCDRVSKKPENRAFFTRADQLHFAMLGFIEPIKMTEHGRYDWLLSQLRLKFERLRDVIN